MSDKELDIIINNVIIIDGTGRQASKGSVGIKDGIIVEIAADRSIAKPATKALDGKKLSADGIPIALAPGFIDMHSHSDLAPFMEGNEKKEMAAIAKISQGITTELMGQDGFSAAPIFEEKKEDYAQHWSALTGYLEPEKWLWNSVEEYLDKINQKSVTRVETLVGHSTLRINVMGYENREPTREELEEMKELLRTAMQQGAVGLSLGLIYPPGMYAKEQELTELAKVVAEEKGVMIAHIRNESERVLEAAEEYLRITKRGNCRVHFSHLKVCGKNKLQKAIKLTQRLINASEEGMIVTFDMYPYDAGSTVLQAILPPWAQKGSPEEVMKRLTDRETVLKMAEQILSKKAGEWENFIQISRGGLKGIVISDAPDSCQELIGKSLEQIGREAGFKTKTMKGKMDTIQLICKLMAETKLKLAMITYNQSMKNVRKFMELEWMTIGTDGVLGRKPHPRLFGAMTKYLRMTREKGKTPIEQAIYQITKHPAEIIRRKERGIIKTGAKADLVLLNLEEIGEGSSYEKPTMVSKGIIKTIIDGQQRYPK